MALKGQDVMQQNDDIMALARWGPFN